MAVKVRRERQSHRFHSMELLSHESHGPRGGDVMLNVTAMVDMMMVLVIFLVMNFNASGEMNFVSKDLKMPEAANGMELTRVPIIAIDSNNNLYFEGAIIADLNLALDQEDLKIAELEEKLVDQRQRFEAIGGNRAEALSPAEDPTTTVNVQADKSTSMNVIKRVLHTCGNAGYSRIRLAVGDARKVETLEGAVE
ncbi:MAG: ExbD/TolR family protein [Myxococcota bacterium]